MSKSRFVLVLSRFKEIASSLLFALEAIRLRRQQDDPAWMLVSEEFRKELLERMSASAGPSHYGTELRESK